MRTYFEPEDTEAFEAAKDLLIRRCMAWAGDGGHSADPFALAAALEFRHHSIDGRLGYWTIGLVEEFSAARYKKPIPTAQSCAATKTQVSRALVVSG